MEFWFNLFISILSTILVEGGRQFLFNTESSYHHRKLLKTLKFIIYILRLWLVVSTFAFLKNIGLIKPLPREIEGKVIFALVVMLIVAVVIAYTASVNKNKKRIA